MTPEIYEILAWTLANMANFAAIIVAFDIHDRRAKRALAALYDK